MDTIITPLKKISQKGLLLVDKPAGITSHDVVDWARKITGVKKIGHTGTLDPLATGLLIILISREFTKLQQRFLKQDKEYLFTAKLGIVTDSYDLEGELLSQAPWEKLEPISQQQLKAAATKFTGKITQTVPAFSAVKRQGKKLYELAREGKLDTSTLPQRQVNIKRLSLTNFNKDLEQQAIHCSFKVACNSGTYIRSLVNDLGQELGVGATMTALRRTKIGDFSVAQALVCPIKKITLASSDIRNN